MDTWPRTLWYLYFYFMFSFDKNDIIIYILSFNKQRNGWIYVLFGWNGYNDGFKMKRGPPANPGMFERGWVVEMQPIHQHDTHMEVGGALPPEPAFYEQPQQQNRPASSK